jgi:thiamine-monophosphate kinase
MGGKPLLALVSMTVTGKQSVGDLDQLYRGIKTLASSHGTTIAGGDTVVGRELSVTIAVIGECIKGNAGLRSGARPGDAVLVTGTLGASQAGLDLLNAKSKIKNLKLLKKHLRPEPRIREACLLARQFRLHGMIDISDGLASELHHLARESRVGIVIDQGSLPVDPAAVAAAGLLGTDVLKYCLTSGEEYELLFTLPPRQALEARRLLSRNGCGCSIIGQAARGSGVRIAGQGGTVKPLANLGYRHF